MKKIRIVLAAVPILISCSNDENNEYDGLRLDGVYRHSIPDCVYDSDFDSNCVDLLEFIDNSMAKVKWAKENVFYYTNYKIINNKIDLEQVEGLETEISLKLVNDSTLIRVEDNSIWTKVN